MTAALARVVQSVLLWPHVILRDTPTRPSR